MRPVLFALMLLVLLASVSASAQTVRYFGVWSYTENAPLEEIEAARLSERRLGYWALEFLQDGSVEQATFHGANGTVWLSFKYVREGERIYADLFSAAGEHVTRKSTQLRDLRPTWPRDE